MYMVCESLGCLAAEGYTAHQKKERQDLVDCKEQLAAIDKSYSDPGCVINELEARHVHINRASITFCRHFCLFKAEMHARLALIMSLAARWWTLSCSMTGIATRRAC